MRQLSAADRAMFERLDPGNADFNAICARIADVLDDVGAHPLTAIMALANLACIALAGVDDAPARASLRDAFVRALNDAVAAGGPQFDA